MRRDPKFLCKYHVSLRGDFEALSGLWLDVEPSGFEGGEAEGIPKGT